MLVNSYKTLFVLLVIMNSGSHATFISMVVVIISILTYCDYGKPVWWHWWCEWVLRSWMFTQIIRWFLFHLFADTKFFQFENKILNSHSFEGKCKDCIKYHHTHTYCFTSLTASTSKHTSTCFKRKFVSLSPGTKHEDTVDAMKHSKHAVCKAVYA